MKGAADPTCHVHLLPDFGAYSRGFDPLFSVRYEPHAFRGGDATLRPQARLLRFCLVAGCHPRPGDTRAIVQRLSTVDATHTLRGYGTFWGSLRPEHRPGRRAAEGRNYVRTAESRRIFLYIVLPPFVVSIEVLFERTVGIGVLLYGLVWVSYWLAFCKWSNRLIPL